MKWKRIVSEEYTPDDIKTISSIVNGSYSYSGKYTPTKEFLTRSYHEINKVMFDNLLPTKPNFEFVMETSPKKQYPGKTNITVNGNESIVVDSIELNSSIMITLHEWIEVIIHEMIHVQECLYHPEHLFAKKYEQHGEWFMKRAKDFTQYGFRITSTFEGDSETSVDLQTVKDAYDKEMLLQIDKTEDGVPMIIKILKSDIVEILAKLKDMEYEQVVVLRTDRLNVTRLKLTDPRESDDLIVYTLTSKLKSKIEPIEEVETIDLNDIVSEGFNPIKFQDSDLIEVTGEDEDGIHISIY